MKKLSILLGLIAATTAANAQIVINEVYGGGGNSGAVLKNDFIELINNSSAAVSLSGATLQYASAANTFNQSHPLPNITLAPGQTYLIQEAAGAGGTTALNADYVAPVPTGSTSTTPGFNIAGTAFKVALVSNSTLISGPTDANVLDFVGAGTANQFEGTAAAPAPSNTLSISRTNGIDTNNNSKDFTTASPTPKSLSTIEVGASNFSLVNNTIVTDEISFTKAADVKVFSVNGQLVKSANKVEKLNVSSLAKGIYIVTGSVDGKNYSEKIVKK